MNPRKIPCDIRQNIRAFTDIELNQFIVKAGAIQWDWRMPNVEIAEELRQYAIEERNRRKVAA